MSTEIMAPRKKRNTKGTAIAQAILEQYQPQTKEDMQDAICYFYTKHIVMVKNYHSIKRLMY